MFEIRGMKIGDRVVYKRQEGPKAINLLATLFGFSLKPGKTPKARIIVDAVGYGKREKIVELSKLNKL